KEKHLSELKALKAQIHPHFMLNTLNAIYSHAVVEDTSPKLSQLILQFSDTLKYVVYEGQQKYVSLSRELSHIENFIRLQQFRLEDKVDVHFKENISDKELLIPPILLINFIENAFKHTTGLRGNQHKIEIELKEKEGILTFFCRNPFRLTEKQNHAQQGVGLENTLKRLELLYPKQHEIKIDKSNEHFTVHLKIDLK
ncbi:MAG: sensor histidine kinase, partial [Saprospiraceae bacterium]